MSQEYANEQPAGFNNHIKNVAIVGVSFPSCSYLQIVFLFSKKDSFNRKHIHFYKAHP